MRTVLRVFTLLLLLLPAFAQAVGPPPQLSARAWLLIDHGSGQVLAENNPDQAVEPASLTKIMTSYLVFKALHDGRLKRDQNVPVSVKAWKTIGSRMFIEPDKPVNVEQLLHGMIVQSGNDASIALAEAIAGSEEAFANLMNIEAQRLGMNHSHFLNATGLPDPQHLTTANDLATLTRAMIRDYPEDYKLYAIKHYSWNEIKQPNRNRLLWLDEAIDGVKTGHTESAGYCLVASRDDGARRLHAIVLGTESEDARAQQTLKLLNYGFGAYEAVKLYDQGQALTRLKVFKGETNTVGAGMDKDYVLSMPRGVAATPERIKVEVSSRQPLLAPVAKGDRIAVLKLTLDDKPYAEYPLIALDNVAVAGFFGRVWDSIQLWLE